MAEKFLVLRLSSLGDIILAEPIARSLRAANSRAEIHFLTKPEYAELARMMPSVSAVHCWTDETGDALMAILRDLKFDAVFDLHRNWRSRKVCSRLKATVHRADKEWFQRWTAVKLKWLKRKPSHAVERYAAALRGVGGALFDDVPRLSVPQPAQQWWREERKRKSIAPDYCLLAPAAAHETKAAPGELWVGLAASLKREFACDPVLVGAPHERGTLEKLAAALGVASTSIIAESDITRAAAVAERARFAITNDSGLAHLAAAVGTPTVSLFGPTHPILGFAPRGPHAAAFTVNEYCSPCSRHGAKPCYRDQRYCFTRMDVNAIVQALTKLSTPENGR